MRTPKTAVLLLLLTPLIATTALALRILSELKGQRLQLDSVVEKTNGAWKSFETLDGRLGVESQVATLKLKELERQYPALLREVQALRVKPARLVQATQASSQTETRILTTLRDSTLLDTIAVQVFDYHDPYVQIRGIAVGDTQLLEVLTRDTLVQALYRGRRKKPMLWIFSRRQIEQRIALKNPNAHLVHPQTVQIGKK